MKIDLTEQEKPSEKRKARITATFVLTVDAEELLPYACWDVDDDYSDERIPMPDSEEEFIAEANRFVHKTYALDEDKVDPRSDWCEWLMGEVQWDKALSELEIELSAPDSLGEVDA